MNKTIARFHLAEHFNIFNFLIIIIHLDSTDKGSNFKSVLISWY